MRGWILTKTGKWLQYLLEQMALVKIKLVMNHKVSPTVQNNLHTLCNSLYKAQLSRPICKYLPITLLPTHASL